MTRLLTINNDKLMIEGYDLAEIANMYEFSVSDFLTLFSLYLKLNQDKLKGGYKLFNGKSEIFTPTTTFETYPYGEILVANEEYEDMKRRIFDFAYINCSNIGETDFRWWGLDCAKEYDLERKIQMTGMTYSCIYRSMRSGWNQKVSDIAIDKIDQEKRYALLRKK